MPIVACSTPPGISGIAVVRVSGKGALKNVSSFIKGANLHKKPVGSSVHLLVDKDDVVFDEAVITTYLKPNSYTGENMVEISCHGNPVIVSKIIDLSLNFLISSTFCSSITLIIDFKWLINIGFLPF